MGPAVRGAPSDHYPLGFYIDHGHYRAPAIQVDKVPQGQGRLAESVHTATPNAGGEDV
jgi:hypothetical protein